MAGAACDNTARGAKQDAIEAQQKADEKAAEAKAEAREEAAEGRPDPLLRESAAILADALTLLDADRKLTMEVLPGGGSAGHWIE